MKTSLGFIMAVLFCPYVLSQEIISGTITGENNKPLEGAHIQNGKFKTTSDANGKFEVGCSDKNEIKITFIFYVVLQV